MTKQISDAGRQDKAARQVGSFFLGLAIVLLCMLLIMTTAAVPQFNEMFTAIESPDGLPLLTVVFVMVPPPVYAAVLIIAILALVFVDRAHTSMRRRRNINMVVCLVLISFVILLVVAMYLPLVVLIGPLR
jgi:uncharacterized membrane protein YidH (DUF202 family)